MRLGYRDAVRKPIRALVVAVAGATAGLLTATPALADSATDPGPGLTTSETLGIFVGIPVLVVGLIYGIVHAVTGRSQPRYRQGAGWTAQPQWWNGPVGGPAAPLPVGAGADALPVASGGGARAKW